MSGLSALERSVCDAIARREDELVELVGSLVGFDTVTFNGFGVPTGRNGGTTLEGGGGIAGKLTRYVSLYGDASFLTGVSGESRDAIKGNVGLRVTW